MLCSECQTDVQGGVFLSRYKFLCLSCYEEMKEAYMAENRGRTPQSQSELPSPEELHRRIAEVRQRIGNEPHDIGLHVVHGVIPYVPKKVAYRSARRGTEDRAL